MRISLLCTILILLCGGPAVSMSQEIVYPPGVLQKQQHVPEAVIYGILLHQAAVFKDKADELDRSGGDGSPYRHHMEAKFGLTPGELVHLDEVAIKYQDNVREPDKEIKESVARFRAMHATLSKGRKVLPPPSEAKFLLSRHDDVALRSRDEFHAFIGDREFARIDALVKYGIVSHLRENYSPRTWERAATSKYDHGGEQGVLGYTSIDFDRNTLEVTAYSETDIYGYGIYYYEPVVSLSACGKHENERASNAYQSDAFMLMQCKGNTGEIFSAFGTHSVEIDSEYLDLKDDDYYGLERWGGFDVMDALSFPFTSFSPETDMDQPVINLGETYALSIWHTRLDHGIEARTIPGDAVKQEYRAHNTPSRLAH